MQTYRKSTLTANPRPKPGRSQSRVTFVGEFSYKFSFATCQPKMARRKVAKNAQTTFAIVERLTNFKSRNQPQKRLAAVAAMPDVRAPKVRARTEKYFERCPHLYCYGSGRVVTYQACRQTDDNNVVPSYPSQRVQVIVLLVLLEVFVLFVEHLLRRRQLDWESADPSHSVFFAPESPCHLAGCWDITTEGPQGRGIGDRSLMNGREGWLKGVVMVTIRQQGTESSTVANSVARSASLRRQPE
jgi:hypothetical protein